MIKPNKAAYITLLGLLCSLVAVFLALKNELWLAFVFLMASGIADMLDGVVARSMNLSPRDQELGKTLDSLVDVCSFGFAPVVILYHCGLSEWPALIGLALYLMAVVWRLATFPLIGVKETKGRRVYTGLPVTYASLFLPLAALTAFIDPAWTALVFQGLLLLLTGLMLSQLPVPRPGKGGMLALVFLALGMASLFIHSSTTGRVLARLEKPLWGLFEW